MTPSICKVDVVVSRGGSGDLIGNPQTRQCNSAIDWMSGFGREAEGLRRHGSFKALASWAD